MLTSVSFGLAVLPELLVPRDRDHLTVLELKDAPALTFGIYYKPFTGDGLLKEFLQIAKQCFRIPDAPSES